MNKKKKFVLVCKGTSRGWGPPALDAPAPQPPQETRFGGPLDYDPVLDPIRGRKRPTAVESWRMSNWCQKDRD